MKTITQHLRDRLESLAGLVKVDSMPDLDALIKSEGCWAFELARFQRMIMGSFRYGLLGKKGKPIYDRVQSIIHRMNLYNMDGNAEHLVDVANLALIEFVEGTHQGLKPTDDADHHTKVKGN